MATIKYSIQSKAKNKDVPIYVTVSLDRNKRVRRKTSLFIDPSKWTAKNQPNQKDETTKKLAKDLNELKGSIQTAYNDGMRKGLTMDGNWLETAIDTHFDRSEIIDTDYLVSYGQRFLTQLKYKEHNNGNAGVSTATYNKYRTVIRKLTAFDTHTGKRHRLVDVDLNYRMDLITYLSITDRLSDNTVGRYLKFVKTIVRDAAKHGKEVNNQLEFIKGFTVKAPKVILSLDDIEILKNKKFVSDKHNIARDWLIIGCFTGQRASDLLRMNTKMVQHIQHYDFIVLEQQKTKKTVQIPIHHEVKTILAKRGGAFPPTFANTVDSGKALFNRYLKELCKLAELDTIENGNKFNKKTKRYENGDFAKHKLVSSHICRRSFATNHYATELYPTPILMNITGHSTEKMFLEYIGKKPIDHSLQLAKTWETVGLKAKQREENNVNLTVYKPAINE